MTTQEKKKFKEVDKAFFNIQHVFSSVHHGQYGKQYFKLHMEEEKQHRRSCPDSIKSGLTISEAVKLFFVQYLVKFLDNTRKIPDIKQVLTVRPSYIFAGALVLNYGDDIKKALNMTYNGESIDIEVIKSLDYAELMKDDKIKGIL